METSGKAPVARPRSSLQRTQPAKQARPFENSAQQASYGLGRSNQTQHRALQVFPTDLEASVNVDDQRAPAMDG
ncbi:hypothetical protein ACVIU7_009234 [Bradyrhizobium liaoningense]